MNKYFLNKSLLLLILLLLGMRAHGQWVADIGDGNYRNPIIYADYSDPDVIRVGDDYWMVASSFTCIPGIPVLHSKDLVNWKIVNHVYNRLPLDKYNKPAHGEGSWAPSIRYHNGMYYVYFCTPNDGLFVARTTDPCNDWELTQMVDVVKWEDPCPFWDEDGNAYLVHSIHRGGPAIIHRMSEDGLRLLDNGTVVYHDEEANPILEGLKMDKRDGWYYIFAPAGGVENGWQTVLRSRYIFGPYEARKVMEEGDSGINGPHQGALLETPTGEWWFVNFQSKGIYGRVTHLQPAHWTQDGWIVIGEDKDGDGIGNPVTVHRKPDVGKTYPIVTPQTSDDFLFPTPGEQWQWQANPKKKWYDLTTRPGYMRLYAIPCPSEHGNLYYAGNLYLQKIPAPTFTAITNLEANFTNAGECAGLLMMGNEYSYIALEKSESANRIVVRTGKYDKYAVTPQEKSAIDTDANKIWLKVDLLNDRECQYFYSLDGKTYNTLGGTCAVMPGTWIGAKVGIFASSPNLVQGNGYADFDYFEITK
ncbi:MAG: glycoside hydrolase 43 family protein [Duncaniella sp.]|nr:glycoside hydrolase 43 family protein [Muribaculum sp.]MCM1255420.1 glycoside hydrolase 43 family protein [Duncaniella sp.]